MAKDEQAQQPQAAGARGTLAPCGTPLPAATLPDGTRPLMHGLARAFWAYKQVYEAELGLSGPALGVLLLLLEQDGLSQNDLTGIMRVDPSLITRIVKQLERERGWISRRRDPADNRLVRVYLTDTGRERALAGSERALTVERRLTAGLSAREIGELHRLLGLMERNARGGPETGEA